MRTPFLPALCWTALTVSGLHRAAAQSPQFVPAYPLYCQGPLTPSLPGAGGQTNTGFKWAATGAGAAKPGPGQCSWADRAARGSEIQAGGGNVICDWSGAMKSLPAGKFLEIGVERDPLVNNCMHLSRYLGDVSPPFSAAPALAPFTRPSIASLSAAQIASLRHGIAVMMSRPATDPTSYRFQANIHGTEDTATTPAEMEAWDHCQHGSYFFFSWHRMYLYFFDRILRAAAGDPNLVLPYWNWTDPAQRALPAPFRTPANASSNPLYIAPGTGVSGRPAALDAGTQVLGASTVAYAAAFADTAFDSPAGSGDSFGGQIVPPEQFNFPHGDFESQPHDVIHGALGGLMGVVDTSAQDPIFWLHHANIDRMWNRWVAQGGGRTDATDATWLNTQFTFYDEAGHAVYLTGSEVESTATQLNYRYDDDPLLNSMARTAAKPLAAPAAQVRPAAAETVATQTLAQSATAAASRITLAGETATVQVPLPDDAAARLRSVLAKTAGAKVFLRLDDIQAGTSSGVYYEIYIDPPATGTLTANSPGFVGNLSLFGVKPHAVAGHAMPLPSHIFADFNVTSLLRTRMASNPKELSVVLVPRGLFSPSGEPMPVAKDTQGTLGSVRLVSR